MPTSAEFQAMREQYGEDVLFCQWCDRWLPRSKMLNRGASRFLGTTICSSCYHNFRKFIKNDDNVQSLLAWVEKNTGIRIEIA